MSNAIPEAATVLGSLGTAGLATVALNSFTGNPIGKIGKKLWDKGKKSISTQDSMPNNTSNVRNNSSNSTSNTQSNNGFKNQHSDSFNSFSNDSISGNKNQNSLRRLYGFNEY